MNGAYKNFGGRLFRFVTMHAFNWRTDRETDRQMLTARPPVCIRTFCRRMVKRNDNCIFTALHGMQTQSSDENSVRPSVCHTRVLWQNGRKICPDLHTIRKIISLVFWEEWLVGATHSTWNFGSTDPRWSEIADFQSIFARSSSAVTLIEKS